MREHVKTYLEIEEQIEELTGDKAAAVRRLAERESHIKYGRSDGNYDVNQSKATAPGENYLLETPPTLKATEPISGKAYTPGDTPTAPALNDKRPISPTFNYPQVEH